MTSPKIHAWIKTTCGRAKYAELDAQKGALSRIRLGWFIFFATIKDWNLSNPDQSNSSGS
jgi:hypothetical protein